MIEGQVMGDGKRVSSQVGACLRRADGGEAFVVRVASEIVTDIMAGVGFPSSLSRAGNSRTWWVWNALVVKDVVPFDSNPIEKRETELWGANNQYFCV